MSTAPISTRFADINMVLTLWLECMQRSRSHTMASATQVIMQLSPCAWLLPLPASIMAADTLPVPYRPACDGGGLGES